MLYLYESAASEVSISVKKPIPPLILNFPNECSALIDIPCLLFV